VPVPFTPCRSVHPVFSPVAGVFAALPASAPLNVVRSDFSRLPL